MRNVWTLFVFGGVFLSSSGASANEVELKDIEPGRSVRAQVQEGFDWSKVSTAHVLPVRFELDSKRHARRYDPRARRVVDTRLSAEDELVLSSYFARHLSDGACLAESDGSASAKLLVEPVIVSAQWTRPSARTYTSTGYLDARSVRAGGGEARFDVYQVVDGERQLVAQFSERYSARLGDQNPRVDAWFDTKEALRRFSDRLDARLVGLGAGCGKRG